MPVDIYTNIRIFLIQFLSIGIEIQLPFAIFAPMTIEQIVGDNIRFIRQKRNISQEGLAFDADMSRSYVGEVEQAKRNISINRLTRLAKALGVGPEVLLIPEYYRTVEW